MCFVHAATMCSALEFLFLTVICIVIIHGGYCHEEWKRQSDGSGSPSEHTISEYSQVCVYVSRYNQIHLDVKAKLHDKNKV